MLKHQKKIKKKIEGIISDYFLERKTLQQTYLLVDIRLKPQQIDLEFMIWLNKNNIFFKLIFTKSDKLNKTDLDKNPRNYLKILRDSIGIQPKYFLSSSKSNYGKNEILKDIENEIKT
jgi:GTP-binding protein